jgi:hypothetical protein
MWAAEAGRGPRWMGSNSILQEQKDDSIATPYEARSYLPCSSCAELAFSSLHVLLASRPSRSFNPPVLRAFSFLSIAPSLVGVPAPPLLESLSFPCTPRTLVGLPITTLASTAAPFIPTNFARTHPEKTCKTRHPALSLPPLSVSLPQTSLLHLARTASTLQTRYRVSAAPARRQLALVDLPGQPSLTDTAETLRSHTSVNAFRQSTPA